MKALLDNVVAQANQIILGKEHTLRLALACLIARGHVLIEDLPGLGKTTLAHVLAGALGLKFNRIQFTSDLLADEVNRATPKTQSALLEAMEEHQVTLEGETRALPEPFFVIATQNPTHLIGTFPLPESQLDRFMMRIEMGYPDARAERTLLKGRDRRELIAALTPGITPVQLLEIQQAVQGVHVADALLDYVQALLEFSRAAPDYQNGLSPRAGLALVHCAQAWALMEGRSAVLPEDVQAVLPGVVGHRLQWVSERSGRAASAAAHLLSAVAIP